MDSVNEVQVQATNDESIVSKCSTIGRNYIKDDFLNHFVGKKQRRTPLIHLGYYTRAVILEKLIHNFIRYLGTQGIDEFNIVSCGCGFDTIYWRLKEAQLLTDNSKVIEIDFPDLIKRKYLLIKRSKILQSYLSNFSDVGNSDYFYLNENYILIGKDLSEIEDINDIFIKKLCLNLDTPTLFLSECAITYMKVKHSSKLLTWMATFKNSCFINYEQITPFDSFGVLMRKHFDKLGSSLQSITNYADCFSHQDRCINSGFYESIAVSEWNALLKLATLEELSDALQRELFDEFEEFHEKCLHYVISVSCSGTWCPVVKTLFQPCKELIDNRPGISPERRRCELRLYGLASCQLDGKTLCFGGFSNEGRSKKIFSLDHDSCHEVQIENNEVNSVQLDMVHGNAEAIELHGKTYVVLYGGRTSPDKISNKGEVVILEFVRDTKEAKPEVLHENAGSVHYECGKVLKIKKVTSDCRKPQPRYRCSLVILRRKEGCVTLWMFGGRTPHLNESLADLWKLTIQQNKGNENELYCTWSSVESSSPNRPCGRMSHSAVADDEQSVMYVSGGFCLDNLTVLSDIWRWCAVKEEWDLIEPKHGKLYPRYGHTSHFVDNVLYLVGGITSVASLSIGIALVDMTSLTAIEIAIEETSTAPFLLFNHCSNVEKQKNEVSSIRIYGGGGNLFSFGTFINNYELILEESFSRYLDGEGELSN